MLLTPGFTIVSTVEHAAGILTQLLGLAALAAILAAFVALAYRWTAGSATPSWLAILVGVAGVALYLGTTPALEQVVRDEIQPGEPAIALFNVAALAAGAGGAQLGRRFGDRFGTDVLLWSPTQDAGEGVGMLAQTVGQVTTVELPREVHDAAGYDPVPVRTKRTLENKTLLFPRGLTVEQLDERLRNRLRTDYGIGAIDLEFDDDGNVSYLGVGTRAAGIGSTLPPATNAVAIRADPGFSASTGDIVQVWEPDSMQRVLTGELRGVADDIVTIAIDASDTPRVDPTRPYRLVTLPVTDRPDREFASLLRAATETFSSLTVEAGSPLHGMPVGGLDLTVTAIRPENGDPVPFPEPRYRLAPGDLLFVIATPPRLRRLESAAEPLHPSLAETTLTADQETPTESIQTAEESQTERTQPTGEGGLPASEGAEDQTDGEEDDSLVAGKADGESFKEIKEQFEQTDAETNGSEAATGSDDDADDTAVAASADSTSFTDLKDEFDSGDADWDDDADGERTSADDVEIAFEERESDAGTESDSGEDSELTTLEDAEIEFGSDDDDSENGSSLGDIEIDEDLQGEDEESSVADDIGNLEFDEEETDEAADSDELDSLDDEGAFDFDDTDSGDDAESDTDADDGDDDDDDDESSGGGGSFAALKEEFESGDADWDDDIDDSPGGDMRLDE